MSEQLLKDKMLLSNFLKDSESKPTDEHIENIVNGLTFVAGKKLARKFDRLRIQNALSEGMIVTVKDKEMCLLYAGKVHIEPERVGIGNFEIYINY